MLITGPFNNRRTLIFKTQLRIAFFAAVYHNYDDNQKTIKRNKLNGLKSVALFPPTDVSF